MSLREMGVRRADIVLTAALLLAAAAIASTCGLMPAASIAVVESDGKAVLTLALPIEHAYYDIEGNGYHLTLESDAGRVRISHADCPDQTCARTGWIERSGSAIVCVPGRVLVRLQNAQREDVDAVLQ